MKQRLKMGVVVVTTFGATACGDPAVGSWSGSYVDRATKTSIDVDMTLESDGSGTSEQSFASGSSSVVVTYDVTWEETDKGEYAIKMECSDLEIDPPPAVSASSCATTVDIEFECALSDEKDKLHCTTDGRSDLWLE